jgi:Spy/CpxP family protein refolding chaperone
MKHLIIFAILAFSMMSFAQSPAPSNGKAPNMKKELSNRFNHQMRMLKMLPHAIKSQEVVEKLGITAEQIEKLKKVGKNKDEFKALEEKMRAADEKQFALFLSDNVDEVAVMMVIDEMSEVKKEIAKAKARELLSIKSVLTPEQLSKLPAVLLERQKSKRPASRK